MVVLGFVINVFTASSNWIGILGIGIIGIPYGVVGFLVLSVLSRTPRNAAEQGAAANP